MLPPPPLLFMRCSVQDPAYLLERATLYASTPLERALAEAAESIADEVAELQAQIHRHEEEIAELEKQSKLDDKQIEKLEALLDRYRSAFDEIYALLDPDDTDEAKAVYGDIFDLMRGIE